MKKILATLVAFGLVFQTCAFAANDMTVSYNKDTNKISADATVGADANTPVVLTVAEDNGEALSIDNLPVFMYLYKTAAGGVLDLDITMPADIISGKYVVSYNAKSGSDSKKVMIVNVNDNSVGGTISVLAEINGAANDTALATILKASAKMDKLGVDPDVMADRAAFADYAAKILVAEKSGDWTVDSFITAYNRALALSAAKAGKHIDAVMKNYASEFGTTYEEYKKLEDDKKTYAANEMKNFDYVEGNIAAAYTNIFAIMDYKAADTWGELRDVIEVKRANGGDGLDFRCYDEIDVADHEDLFDKLMDAFADCKLLSEIRQSFWDITSDYYVNDDGQSGEDYVPSVPSQGGDWGNTNTGGGATPNIIIPAVPNPNGKDQLTTITGPQTDEKTEKATPAPTVAPVPTEAPALEPGVFADTADHWAKDYVKTLAQTGVVGGYDDGTFRPNNNATRAEYIKMIVSAFDFDKSGEAAAFADTETHWAKDYIAQAAAAGLVEGDGGNFNPNATITRQDAAVILHRLGLIAAGETEISFADEASVADYATEAVATLASAGIINGSEGNFNPTNAITRAEIATILYRTIEKVVADEEATEAPVEGETEAPAEEATEEEVVEDATEEEVVEDATEEEVVENTTEEEVAEDATEEEVADETTEETEAVVEETKDETADEVTETE